jgi:hypothetical protein
MTPLAWANFPLALAFILAFAGIPLWMTFKRPQTIPDHTQAHAYLAAKEAALRSNKTLLSTGGTVTQTRVLTRHAT